MNMDTDISIAGFKGYSRQALATALKQQSQTLASWVVRGKGPKYMKIGRIVVYPLEEVEKWLDQQLRNPGHKEKA